MSSNQDDARLRTLGSFLVGIGQVKVRVEDGLEACGLRKEIASSRMGLPGIEQDYLKVQAVLITATVAMVPLKCDSRLF